MTIVFRCAQIDLLNRELIEAYRRVEDKDLFCIKGDEDAPDEVATLHHQMREHRNSCELCKRILRLAMDDLVERKSAALTVRSESIRIGSDNGGANRQHS